MGIAGIASLDPAAIEHDTLLRMRKSGSPSTRVFKIVGGSMSEIGSDLIVPVQSLDCRRRDTAPLIPASSAAIHEQL